MIKQKKSPRLAALQQLTPAAREIVWRNFGAIMDVAHADADYCALARSPLGGHQIKDVFGTAQALAADEGERIDMAHVNTMLEVRKGFDLAQMKGQLWHKRHGEVGACTRGGRKSSGRVCTITVSQFRQPVRNDGCAPRTAGQ